MTRQPKHGTVGTYKRYRCRCDECREAMRAYDLAYHRKRGRLPRGNPCEADGVTYASQNAAARATGKSKSTVCYHLTRRADLSRLGKPRAHNNGGRKKAVRIAGRQWPSQVALAEYLGRPVGSVRGWIRHENMNALIGALVVADAREAKNRKAA